MCKFVDVKTDIAFKKIFGGEQHKEILIGFLNALLELAGDKRIHDATLKNPWQPPDILWSCFGSNNENYWFKPQGN